jgi:hypothetical protein
MKNQPKQDKKSGKVQLAMLVAVVLAAGSAGVWSELKAAPQATTAIRSSEIDVYGQNIFGSISLNGDGTASVFVFQNTSVQIPCDFFACFETTSQATGSDPANTSYTQTVNIKPGASGKQIGSGVTTATLAGTSFDPSTLTFNPAVLSLQMQVQAAADDVSTLNNHTLDAQLDPSTGKIAVLRQTKIGVAATGNTAGSISLSVNGAPYWSETGVIGVVQAFSTHTVTRLQ